MSQSPTHRDDPLEQRTLADGRELLAQAEELAPSLLRARWWDERLMQWSMAAPELKVRLFRLVDVLPALPDRRAVLEHLKEYLGQRDNQPAGLGSTGEASTLERLLHLAPAVLGGGGTLRGRLSAAAVLRAVRRLARRFVAGGVADEAIETIRRLRQQRMTFSLDLLGEQVLSEREADLYAERYVQLIDALTAAARQWPEDPLLDLAESHRQLPRVNLSIKLTSLYSQFDPLRRARSADAVLARLRPILRRARRRGSFIHVDMEHYEVKDLTLEIFEKIAGDDEFADWRDIGIVIQAYLRDSGEDLERMVRLAQRRFTPLTIRLVKGAYWDYENVVAAQRGWPVPVFAHKHQTDANFERLTRRLLSESELLDPAIASHNVRSIAHALAVDEQIGLPPGKLEFQMLYGMGDPIKAALVARGQRVRVYAPFGELIPGMAYLTRRLLENTANESFLRQGFVEGVDVEQLLRDPEQQTPPLPPATQPRLAPSPPARPDAFANEPDSDFAKEAPRVQMKDALERVRQQLGLEVQLVIDGRAGDGETVHNRENPADPEQVVARVQMAGLADADRAVAAAERAAADWAATGVVERAELLQRLGDHMAARRFELAAWEVFETGKPWREADADVSEAIDYCRYYAAQAMELFAQPIRQDVPGEANVYRYLPRGVGLIIAPWNFPLAIVTGMTTAALAGGNTVVVKPSEQSSAVAAKLFELLDQAGFPPGVANLLPGRGETVGDYLVGHPGVDFIAFTGSRQVGMHLYAKAAANAGRRGPKHVVCEMGGKNAIIVDADADLDDAVRGIVASAFGYSGQKCSACSRAIVVGDAYLRLNERVVEAARSLTIGPPADPENFMGPLIDQAAFDKVRRYVDIGRREGTLLLDSPVDRLGPGYYVGPTVFGDVEPSARIAREEIFGPVLAVMHAADFEQALRIANGVDFALTGGLYSRSPRHIERATAAFRVGNLYINRKITGALVERQPFGGFAFSGLGSKAGGPDYLRQFVVPQTLTENTLRHGFAPEFRGRVEHSAAGGRR